MNQKIFDKDTMVSLWSDNYECWFCEGNRPDSIHHIIPRSDTFCSNSPLNSAPMCNYPCHLNNHGLITTEKWKAKLLQKTIRYLLKQNYALTQQDLEFYLKHQKLYEQHLDS
jgi:hypothetical protein